MVTCSFKLRINGIFCAYSYYGETTGLDSARKVFDLAMESAFPGDVVELCVITDTAIPLVLKRDSK